MKTVQYTREAVKDLLLKETVENKDRYHINNDIITFDTEACTVDENTVITYVWCARINDGCVYGRTPSEFRDFIEYLTMIWGKSYIWVHNLPYDFVYISDCLKYGGKEFSKGAHRTIKYNYENIEFRCTYALSNLSLEDLAKKYNLPTQKGHYDYTRIMHYDTPLTEDDIKYITADVGVVHDYVQMFMEGYESYAQVELTQTARLRTLYRSYVHKYASVNGLRKRIKEATANPEIYKDLREITYGAYSHTNYRIAGDTLTAEDDITLLSADIMSDYPYHMLAHKYPYQFRRLPDNKQFVAYYIKHFAYNKNMASYATFTFPEIIVNEVDCPYLPSHKVECDDIIKDNGKIAYAKNLKIKLSNIDYQIVKELYNFSEDDLIVENIHTAPLDYLPLPMIMLIIDLYEQKTELKGNADKKREYENIKELINALFGMNLYDINKPDAHLEEDGTWSIEQPDLEKKLKRIKGMLNNRKYGEDIKDPNEYRLYQWGCWITSYARQDLLSLNKKVTMRNVLYNDTDSIKFICYNREDRERILNILAERDNEVSVNLAEMCEAMKRKWDIDITLQDLSPRGMLIGTMPIEAEYKMFKALCAKRYLTLEEQEIDGKVYHVITPTVAGCKKSVMKRYLTKNLTPDYTTEVDGKTFVHFAQKDLEIIFNRFSDGLTIPAEESENKLHNYTPPAKEEITVRDYLDNFLTLTPTRGIALISKPFTLNKSQTLTEGVLCNIQRTKLSGDLSHFTKSRIH